jgi:hypothetical protein
MRNSAPGYDGYPTSYDARIFNTAGMAGLGYLGGAPNGYVGNATVTTNDPPPAGDLKIHSAPSASSPQIGGADKDAIVEVVTEPGLPAGWGKVGTFGSPRNPQVVGYAALAYLTPIKGQGQVEPATPGDPPSPGVPNVPGLPSVPEPSSTLRYGLIGLAVLAAGGAAYYFFGD